MIYCNDEGLLITRERYISHQDDRVTGRFLPLGRDLSYISRVISRIASVKSDFSCKIIYSYVYIQLNRFPICSRLSEVMMSHIRWNEFGGGRPHAWVFRGADFSPTYPRSHHSSGGATCVQCGSTSPQTAVGTGCSLTLSPAPGM